KRGIRAMYTMSVRRCSLWTAAFVAGVLTVAWTWEARSDPGKGEAPKGEAPKGEAPKGEAPKGEAPKGDASKANEPAGKDGAKSGQLPVGLLDSKDWLAFSTERLTAGEIDRLVEKEWAKVGIKPAPPVTDEQFLRRATIDLTGRLPTAAEMK